MEHKKEYIEPAMELVHLDTQINLLGSSCPDGVENCGEFGLAPHEQDPIA